MRAIEPDCYPQDYFRDPKLFWFIANNPTVMPKVPANIAAITQAMIDRGVEQADLDYTLELVISNSDEIMGGHQAEVLATLLAAGAKASPQAIVVGLAHWQHAPVRALLDHGMAMTAPIAAALGRNDELAALLPRTSRGGSPDCAGPRRHQPAVGGGAPVPRCGRRRQQPAAGAQALDALAPGAINEDLPMLQLLVARGAKLDTRDTLWDATPLNWAVHNGKTAAEAYLRSLG